MRVRQQGSLNRHFGRNLFAALAAAVLSFACAADCLARQTQGVTSPARGLQPAGSYALGDIETISTKNGNLMLHIPLVSLPAGRGGSSAGIGLYYNSKLYEAYSTSGEDNQGNNIVLQQLRPSPEGGWRYGLRYSLTLTNLNEYRLQGFTCGSDPGVNYIYKLQVNFPDGSSHVLHRAGQAEYGGFSRNRPDGWIYDCLTNSNSPAVTGPMVYYSTDGSYLRLAVDHDSDGNWENNSWTLSLPDGTRVTGVGPSLATQQQIYDRNNNFITIRNTTFNGHDATEVVDELERVLRIESNPDLGKDFITQSGPGDIEVKWTVEWASEYVFKTCYAVEFPQGQIQEQSGVNETLGVVSKITLPAEAGSLTYEFQYNADPETGIDGWGELSSIKLPGGAKVSYKYNMDGLDLDTNPVTYKDVLENFPTEKLLTYDDLDDDTTAPVTERLTYNSIRGPYNAYTTFVIEGPDGGVTTEKFSETAWLPRQYAGQPYRTENSDGTVIERVFEGNVPNGAFPTQTQAADEPWSTNPVVTKEFRSVRNAAGALSKTALTEYTYDKNGNVLAVKEYDWVDYIKLSHDANGRPVGLTVIAPLKKVTTNSYYNPTPVSSDTSNAPNSYHNSSAPKLLHLIESTEVGDAAATLSRAELSYDSLARGNLTEQRRWDSMMGGLDRPLAPGTFISVSRQYDTYGNLTHVTDANGVQTQFVYDPVNGVPDLYPTKTVKALGTSVARTTLQEYDFQTGLVTSMTDADNAVSTVTVYDALGRPKLIRAAADKPEETQRAITYADAERRVVTRSDLALTGDGEMVSVQHFDQLGRPRLERTLEKYVAADVADESKGIKVQTRYFIDKPAHRTYRLISNPYRAAKATEAGGESTMGWTLTTADQGGRVIRTESFGGAALPAPFGTGNNANTNSTGAVATTYDANAVVVTDQALRQSRSVADGLGRLVQVFEAPDDPGNNYETSYTYDANGNLTQVLQGTQTRMFVYSSLSRLTSVMHPEVCSQEQSQCVPVPVTYDYYADGTIFHKTDARGVVTTYSYDELGRMTARDYSDNTPDVAYFYDSQLLPPGAPEFERGKSAGHLVAVTYGGGRLGYYTGDFDASGRPRLSSQVTDTGSGVQTYTLLYDYHLDGRLKTETYPSGKIVETQYDAAGRVAGVKRQGGSYYAGGDPNATNSPDILKYTAHGAVSVLKLGNQLWEHMNFNSRLQPVQIGLGTGAADSSTLRLDYTYGTDDSHNNGNIRTQTITVPGMTEPFVQSYEYDKLNRLSSAQEMNAQVSATTPAWKQVYSYDRYGNRTLTAETTYPAQLDATNNPTASPANNRFTSAGYSYDMAGNLKCDALHLCALGGETSAPSLDVNMAYFDYDAENRMVRAGSGGRSYADGGTSYTYNGEGRRVRKAVTGGEVTVFVYDTLGRAVAEYSNQVEYKGTRYLTQDQMGSTRVVTDSQQNAHSINGAGGSRHDYFPFGEKEKAGTGGRTTDQGYAVADSVRQGFTGYEADGETQLNYAKARYQSPSLGRFTSPDPYGPWAMSEEKKARFLSSPQQWDRYTYAMNNPLKFLDPTGLEVYDPDSVSEENQRRIHDALVRISIQGTSEQRRIARHILKNAVLINVIGSGSTITGGANLINRDAANADIAKGWVSMERAASHTKISINSLNLLGSPQSAAALEGTLVHEGRHAYGFARTISSLSSGQGPDRVFDPTLYKNEYESYMSEAYYYKKQGGVYHEVGLDTSAGEQVLKKDGETVKVNSENIKEILASPYLSYGVTEQNQGLTTTQKYGLKPPPR